MWLSNPQNYKFSLENTFKTKGFKKNKGYQFRV